MGRYKIKADSRSLRTIARTGLVGGSRKRSRGRSRKGNFGTYEERIWKILDPKSPAHEV